NIPRLPTIAATGIGGMAALVRGDLPDAVRRLGEAIDKGESGQ
ncbi:MAG: LuxR family transcriptional regulator, partial [Actinomycetota bacterium]|nr:LuxR family transcriptional regulator [Actinomycetota bacterium]